jgi:sterol 3beta-glucosyltransferase
MGHLAQSKITFIYNFSQVCVERFPSKFDNSYNHLGGCAETSGLGRHYYCFRIVSEYPKYHISTPHPYTFSWFLNNPDLNWTPPPSLLEWMAKAKADEKPIVYIGFGSITVPNPRKVTEIIVAAVMKSMWASAV